MKRHTFAGIVYMLLANTIFAGADAELVGPNTPAGPSQNPRLCVPAAGNVFFHGLLNTDKASGPAAPILYPAPNLAGFLAAIATQGVIVGSAISAQKMKQKSEADNVLNPYEEVLSRFTLNDLYLRCVGTEIGRSQKIGIEDKQHPEHGLHIEASPSFAMTQDEKAIILTNEVIVRGSTEAAPILFQGTIKVVPKPAVADDIKIYWNSEDGENLKRLSAELFADSLYAALDLSRTSKFVTADTFKTLRYQEGSSLKFERGQLISESCDRIIMKTLRGAILVVPGSC